MKSELSRKTRERTLEGGSCKRGGEHKQLEFPIMEKAIKEQHFVGTAIKWSENRTKTYMSPLGIPIDTFWLYRQFESNTNALARECSTT